MNKTSDAAIADLIRAELPDRVHTGRRMGAMTVAELRRLDQLLTAFWMEHVDDPKGSAESCAQNEVCTAVLKLVRDEYRSRMVRAGRWPQHAQR